VTIDLDSRQLVQSMYLRHIDRHWARLVGTEINRFDNVKDQAE
jgi:hypothetical protein